MEEQFSNAYEEYADAIFRHCFFRLGDREKAKDMTQETFVKTWDQLVKYKEEGRNVDNMRAFLYKVANNLIIDSYRKKGDDNSSLEEMMEGGFDVSESVGSESAALSAEVREVRNAMATLEDRYRDIVIMRYIDEMSPKEIAKTVGLTENVVSVRLNRGMKMVKAKLAI